MEDILIIRSDLLSEFNILKNGISTRIGGFSGSPLGLNLSYKVGDEPSNVKFNRELFFSRLGIKLHHLAIPLQIHGDTVRRVYQPGNYECCDALITNKNKVFLVVTVADCLPILLYDSVTKSIGIVHAGWRGCKLRITEKAIAEMNKEFGTECENITAYIGPSAGVCCYEIGQDIKEGFEDKYLLNSDGNKLYLNMKLYNHDILLQKGVPENRIEISPYCTVCNEEYFHSYRRNGSKSGRMMAVIGLTI